MIIKVDNLKLNDGSIYSGDYDDDKKVPFGFGLRKYPNGHEAIGMFCDVPNGVTYINRDSSMLLGFFAKGILQGWGMQMGDGTYRFGIYDQGVLINDYTFLIEDTHRIITDLSKQLRAQGRQVRWAHVYPSIKMVFFGVAEKGVKKVGIRFLPSGDVYMGVSNSIPEITGTFLHLKDAFAESGVFENGRLTVKSESVFLHKGSISDAIFVDEITFNFRDIEAFTKSRDSRVIFFL